MERRKDTSTVSSISSVFSSEVIRTSMETAPVLPMTLVAPVMELSDRRLTPKIEPKVEPFSEVIPEMPSRPFVPPGFELPHAASEDMVEKGTTPVRRMSSDPEEDHVFSEYFRLTRLFLSSFHDNEGGGGDWSIVPSDRGSLLPLARTKRKKVTHRSGEMVRVSDIGEAEQRHFRELARKTRATYDNLRILLCRDEEKKESFSPLSPERRSRGDLKAGALMMSANLWNHRDKRIIGSIPGVSVGDIFFFRMELCVIGLHGQVQGGIDYVPASRSSSGEPICTSIVISGGYEDDEDTGNVIVYTGQGGRTHNMIRHSIDQKLSGGNLALERSMNYGIEVRVIRGFKFDGSPTGRVYVYDGLYRVVKYWQDVGKSGFTVFKYKLVRIVGQDEMGSVVLKTAEELKEMLLRTMPIGYLSNDISIGKENLPVTLFNDIDEDRDPMLFEYVVQPVYPATVSVQNITHESVLGSGCSCTTACSNECYCVEKNGGDFPYDLNGILVIGRPLIYECGNRCSCPPTCRNRVTQRGLRNRLEVFRSRETGWGVRSLDIIRAGSFICEFTGIVLTEKQTEVLSVDGENLIFPHRFPNRWCEWGDISNAVPGYERPVLPSLPSLRFSLDVSKVRNAACYLSHSCSPNVFVQFVLYDHHDVSYPHLMIFALENIPPMREICIDYGMIDGLVANPSP